MWDDAAELWLRGPECIDECRRPREFLYARVLERANPGILSSYGVQRGLCLARCLVLPIQFLSPRSRDSRVMPIAERLKFACGQVARQKKGLVIPWKEANLIWKRDKLHFEKTASSRRFRCEVERRNQFCHPDTFPSKRTDSGSCPFGCM